MKNKARIVRNNKGFVCLEVVVGKERQYFEICQIGLQKDKVIPLSDYFDVKLSEQEE